MKFIIVFFAVIACTFGYITPVHKNEKSLIGSRIVNGNPAVQNQFPWQVSIRVVANDGTVTNCGGSLVTSSWVLTAAFCLRNFQIISLGFGSNNINQPLLLMSSENAVSHPAYNPNNLNNDVALINLPISLSLSDRISTVRLPTLSQISTTFQGIQGLISGFGRSTEGGSDVSTYLNFAAVRIISNAQCASLYSPSVVISSTICSLGWTQPNQGPCDGDTGSALVINENGVWTQIGVMSFISARGCTFGDPSGFVRTASMLQWISTHTGLQIRP